MSFIPILGDFSRYSLKNTYKNYLNVYKNQYILRDLILFIVNHIFSVLEIVGVIYIIIQLINKNTLENYTIYIIIGIIIKRILCSIVIYNNIQNKKKENNKIKNIEKIRKYLKCLNKFLTNPDNKLNKKQINHIKQQLHFMLTYYKDTLETTQNKFINIVYILILALLVTLPIILFIIMYYVYNIPIINIYILITVIVFLLLPYLRIVLSVFDSQEKYPTLWILCHIIEKCIVIMIVYILVQNILNNNFSYDNLIGDFKNFINNIFNFKNNQYNGGNTLLINKFNILFK